MRLLGDRLNQMMMTGEYKPYLTQNAACFAVLCGMARDEWAWDDVKGVIIPDDGTPLYPLWQDYLWAHSEFRNVFGVPEHNRHFTVQEQRRGEEFLLGEYRRAMAYVKPERRLLEGLAQLEFAGWSKVELSRLAGYRAHLLAALEFGPRAYNLGRVQFMAYAGLGSSATAVSVQRWLESVGLVRCLVRGNYYRGRVSTYQLRLPDGPWNEMNNSVLDAYALEDFNEEESLGRNCSFHSSDLGLHALPFSHARIELAHPSAMVRGLGRLAGFILERLPVDDEPIYLPSALEKVARARLLPTGLVKQTVTGGWLRIGQELL